MMMMIFIISLGERTADQFQVDAHPLETTPWFLSPRDVITHYDVKTISKFPLYENLCKGVRIQHEIKKK